MAIALSNDTIKEYLPEIKAILGTLEISAEQYGEDFNKVKSLYFGFLKYDSSRIYHALGVIGFWLKGTKFEVKNGNIYRINENKKAKWLELISILRTKIIELYNQEPIVEILINKSGKIIRDVGGYKFDHQLESDSMKLEIIKHLKNNPSGLDTEDLQKFVRSKSSQSIRQSIGQINSSLNEVLQLPIKQDFILNKPYRINPVYNVVLARN